MNIKSFSLFFIILTLYALPAQAKEFNWKLWQEILSDRVQAGQIFNISSNLVNYKSLLKDPRIQKINLALEQYDPSKLQKNYKKSFYINAYNYYAVLMVLNNYPVDSIKDIGNIFFQVWDKEVATLNNKAITLNDIEHQILRPMGDPRIHFAIVCASMSCPSLSTQVYSANNLDTQLNFQTKLFLNNNSKGLSIKNNELYVSSLFKWFKDDFIKSDGIINFIKQYKAIPNSIENLNYLDYNWQLNDLTAKK
ncbi:hypothetical protein MNBD_GAMMA22-1107 [hydrothermal vent metagenome]|uniref:DUF547 domain-containing protein n=1 Tax=hydrothermal vent metagenome TaxID=652676 RepID=A0A3B1A2R9_9ZZZZ